MQKIYYLYFLSPGKILRQVNDGKPHSNLQLVGCLSFQVRVDDDNHMSYM